MGVVADGSPELMPAESASQAAAGQDTTMLAVYACFETRGLTTTQLSLLNFTQNGFYIDDRRPIDGFNGTDSQTLLAYFAHRDLMNADRIGPIGRACGKHSCEAATRV